MASEFSAESLIERSQQLRRIRGELSLLGECDLEHGGDERGGHAVSGHIGDEGAQVLVVDTDEVVEISGDRGHGLVAGSDIEAGYLRRLAGNDGELDLARGLKLGPDLGELVSQLLAGVAQHEMVLDARADDGLREGLVDVIDAANLEAPGFVLDFGAASEKDDGDVARYGIELEAEADFEAVHFGHEDVEEDEVGDGVGVDEVEGLRAVGGNADAVMILEDRVDDLNVFGRVIDQQDNFLFGAHWVFCASFRWFSTAIFFEFGQRRVEIEVADGSGQGVQSLRLACAAERVPQLDEGLFRGAVTFLKQITEAHSGG